MILQYGINNGEIWHAALLHGSFSLILTARVIINFKIDLALSVHDAEHFTIVKDPISSEHLFRGDAFYSC